MFHHRNNIPLDEITPIKISELSPNSKHFKLAGIIISKRRTKSFTNNKNITRSVWNFTLRDSPVQFINVSAWGSPDYIETLFTTFNVGDVVELINPSVSLRKPNENKNYTPYSTSQFDLNMSDNFSEINFYKGPDMDRFEYCYHLPTRPSESYATLRDVTYYAERNQERKDIDLLAAVKYIGPMRNITTKKGENVAIRELELMDQTIPGFPFHMWGLEVVNMPDKWTPRETGACLSYNSYKKCWALSNTPITIITPDPETVSAKHLREFAKSAPLDSKSIMMQLMNECDVSQITSILSCKAVVEKSLHASTSESFSAMVYCVITEYDLDGCTKSVILKCSHCGTYLDDCFMLCTNALCPSITGVGHTSNLAVFNIKISLTDHTGKIQYCQLSEKCVESMIGFQANKFDILPLDVKTQIKWRYLLKRCLAKIIVLPKANQQKSMISVMACNLVSLGEYSSKVPPF